MDSWRYWVVPKSQLQVVINDFKVELISQGKTESEADSAEHSIKEFFEFLSKTPSKTPHWIVTASQLDDLLSVLKVELLGGQHNQEEAQISLSDIKAFLYSTSAYKRGITLPQPRRRDSDKIY